MIHRHYCFKRQKRCS